MNGPDSDKLDAKRAEALDRAWVSETTLAAAVQGTDISWTMLAAIGLQESQFEDNHQANGNGYGVFQIDIGENPSVSSSQALNLSWSAGWAVTTLLNNQQFISNKITGIPAGDALWMLAASWNTGANGQITRYLDGESPDWHTSPNGKGGFGGQYGQNVLDLMDCFK